jgi:hypothetical protein
MVITLRGTRLKVWFSRKIALCFLAALLMLTMAIFVRLNMLEKHFTHIDDVGVAWSILHLKDEMININGQCKESFIKSITSCRYFWAREKSDELTLPESKVGNMLQKYGLLEKARTAFFLYKSYNIVPLSWTYAPAQFYLTDFLLHPGMSYKEIKFWGRFPSFLFGMIAILFLMYSVKYFEYPGDPGLSIIFVLLLMSTSLQSIIYAAQMESYAVGMFSVSALVVLLGYLLNKKEISAKAAWSSGAVVAGLCMCQYQTLLFIPGFLLAFTICGNFSVKKKLHAVTLAAESFLLIAIPFIFYPLRSHFRNNAGVNWNAGPNGEFVIQSHDSGFLRLIEEVLRQLANLPLVLESMLSPVPESSMYAQTFKWFLFALFSLGVAISFIDKVKRSFLLFSMLTGVIWLLFMIFGKLTFGPTRHSMVLIPIFTMFVGFGFSAILGELRGRSPLNAILVTMLLFWLYAFVTGYKIMLHERVDRFDEVMLDQEFKSHAVDIVVGEYANSPYFMQDINRRPIVIDDRKYFQAAHLNLPLSSLRDKHSISVAIYGRTQLNDVDLHKIYEDIARQLQLPKYKKMVVVKKDEVFSSTEVDWSSRTKNGQNVFFLYIFKVNDA